MYTSRHLQTRYGLLARLLVSVQHPLNPSYLPFTTVSRGKRETEYMKLRNPYMWKAKILEVLIPTS
jgi:hypothetical protein